MIQTKSKLTGTPLFKLSMSATELVPMSAKSLETRIDAPGILVREPLMSTSFLSTDSTSGTVVCSAMLITALASLSLMGP